jgi:EpsD family peptidyl-prolyl cis-trans isomerase
MKKVVLSLFVVFTLFACGKTQTADKGPYLAKVGDVKITEADLESEMQNLPDYAQSMFEGKEGKKRFLDEVIKKEILYQEALKKGLDKSPEFKQKLEEFKKLTLISDLLEKEIMSKSGVSEQDMKDYYEKNKADFVATSQIKASHILVKTKEDAQKILERLNNGEKFEALAKEASIDKVSGKNGGELGYFSRGEMVPEFEKAAAMLKVGEVSKPVKTQFGYHIIKVTDKKTGPVVEFERVKDIIAQKLSGERQKEAFDSYLEGLKKDYKIDVNEKAVASLAEEKEKEPETQPSAQRTEGSDETQKQETRQETK